MEATQGSPTADPPSEGPIYGPHPVNPLSGSSDGQGQDVGDNKVPIQGNKGTSKEFQKGILARILHCKQQVKKGIPSYIPLCLKGFKRMSPIDSCILKGNPS